MSRNIFVPAAAVALAAVVSLACGAFSLPGVGGDSALFKDDFSNASSGWSTFSSQNAAVDYSGGEYVMEVFKEQWFVWGTPNESNLSNVHIEVTAKSAGGTADTSFGVICNYVDDSHYFYMGIDPKGFYAIGKTDGAKEIFLTNNDQWAQSDQIVNDAPSYRLGGDCRRDGTLTLYVDGKRIDSVKDTTFAQGDVGLFAWTDKEVNAKIRFDDFAVTALR